VKFPGEINQEVYEEWKASGAQKSSIIAKYAKTCSLCRKSMDVFFNAYASETGNAMLKWLPTGGFYITGGIGASNLEYFTIDGSK
jgi:glucokinase